MVQDRQTLVGLARTPWKAEKPSLEPSSLKYTNRYEVQERAQAAAAKDGTWLMDDQTRELHRERCDAALALKSKFHGHLLIAGDDGVISCRPVARIRASRRVMVVEMTKKQSWRTEEAGQPWYMDYWAAMAVFPLRKDHAADDVYDRGPVDVAGHLSTS